MSVIELRDLSLTFRVRQHRKLPLKEFLIHRMFSQRINPVIEVRALDGVNLNFGSGERVGIIGHNGAGKSTLLKLLAGVYTPTAGSRIVNGRISSLFDLTLGFAMDVSGWDNISLRSYLMGETPEMVQAKRDEIAEFSELGEFLDTPLRYYSSGMIVRLAFAVVTSIDPDILLIDEVLAAGDLAFQEKARARMQSLVDRARLIVLVSHDLGAVREICNRAIWMDHGQVRMDGPVDEVVDAYEASAAATPGGVSAAAA